MPCQAFSKLARAATRAPGRAVAGPRKASRLSNGFLAAVPVSLRSSVLAACVGVWLAPVRFISTSSNLNNITPDGKGKETTEVDSEGTESALVPANITESEYHAQADEYLELLSTYFESLQESREDIVDVEYSNGVLTIIHGELGTYVVNKQPANKQIWLSSPLSGPKRYDYVVIGDSMHEKQDTAKADWIYLRDKSTMNDLFTKELGTNPGVPAGQYGI